MKITAITKFKHGGLYQLLRKLGWTQSELARRVGVADQLLGEVINLRRRPSDDVMNRIQAAFGEVGEYFDVVEQWPEKFSGIKRGITIEQTKEVDDDHLVGLGEAMMIATPEKISREEMCRDVESALSILSPKQAALMRELYLDDDEKTCADAGRKFNMCNQWANTVKHCALRKLRNSEKLKEFRDKYSEVSI